MNTRNDGGPAFPATVQGWNDRLSQSQAGMSLRDWFAGQALASFYKSAMDERLADHEIARCAFDIADAMLAAGGHVPETTEAPIVAYRVVSP